MNKLTKLLAALGLSLCVTSVFAEPKALTKASEMHGCWERINFSPAFSKQVNPTEYWAQPYQWFCFEADGTTMNMMSTEYRQQTAQSLRSTLSILPKEQTYALMTRGIIRIDYANPPLTNLWQVTFADKNTTAPDGTVVPKGAMIMGLMDPKTDKVAYWRYLKAVK